MSYLTIHQPSSFLRLTDPKFCWLVESDWLNQSSGDKIKNYLNIFINRIILYIRVIQHENSGMQFTSRSSILQIEPSGMNLYDRLVILTELYKQQMSKQKQKIEEKKVKESYEQFKNQSETSFEIIQKLNKLYRVDRILLRHAYDTYPEKQNLQASNEYKLIDKFYKYVFNNLFKIEKSYLEVPDQEQGSAYHYQINKNSVSKFVRDQSEHFRTVFNQFCSKSQQGEETITGTKLYSFIQELFSSEYTAIIMDGKDYLKDSKNSKQEIEEAIKNYCEIVKEMEANEETINNISLSQEQILDFLSFLIKDKENQQFFVLYARTKEKLNSQIQYLKKEAADRGEQEDAKVAHPALVEMPVDHEQQPNVSREEQTDVVQKTEQNVGTNYVRSQSTLEKYQSKKNKGQDEKIENSSLVSKKPTKRQRLESMMNELFVFGCKRRYPLGRSVTFDQIQAQSKTMNLEKFINFCNYFKVTTLLSRELLCEMFKIYAINRLTLDQKRFKQIMTQMIETNNGVIECFLKKQSPQRKHRQKISLSEYKFKLQPLNGKTIETIEEQLQIMKQEKQEIRKQKIKNYYHQRQMIKDKSKPRKKNSYPSYLSQVKTNLFDLDNIRDESFDPQKFFGNDQDDLLIAYQSKIENKDRGLESILDRRLQKGDRVVKKISNTNKNLKLYN